MTDFWLDSYSPCLSFYPRGISLSQSNVNLQTTDDEQPDWATFCITSCRADRKGNCPTECGNHKLAPKGRGSLPAKKQGLNAIPCTVHVRRSPFFAILRVHVIRSYHRSNTTRTVRFWAACLSSFLPTARHRVLSVIRVARILLLKCVKFLTSTELLDGSHSGSRHFYVAKVRIKGTN